MGGVTTLGSVDPNDIFAATKPDPVSEGVTIASGSGVLVRGTVLGKITASGKYTTSLSAASDGSQTPYRILGEDVDATSADMKAPAFLAGNFRSDMLTIGTGHDAASVKAAFEANNNNIIITEGGR